MWKPIEVFTGNWGVQNAVGDLIASGLRSKAEAWGWIFRHVA